MYLSRTMLVTHALERLVSRRLCESGPGTTHNDPRANINTNATLFLKSRFRSFNSAIGSSMITISSKMLNPAPAYTSANELMHLPLTVGSHTVFTGTHCKETAIRNVRMWQSMNPMQMIVIRRNRLFVNMRRYRRRIENLARFCTRT